MVILYYKNNYDKSSKNESDIHKIVGFKARLGNMISAYSYMFLYNRHFGLVNNIYENTLKYPLKSKTSFNPDPREVPELEKYQYTLIINNGSSKHSNSNDVRFYQNYRDVLRKNMVSEKINKSEYDVTIHVRTDDVGNSHPGYSALPANFYKDSLNQILENKKDKDKINILLICKKPQDEFTKDILSSVLIACEDVQKETKKIDKIKVQHDTVEKDFEAILSSPITIMSVSTYSFWGVFLSPFCKEVHIPGWGLSVEMWDPEGKLKTPRNPKIHGHKSTGNMNLDKWISEETKIVVHELNTPKITYDNSHLLFKDYL